MSNLADILKSAMNLDVHDRAALAERLLASLEELTDRKPNGFGRRSLKGAWSSTAPVVRRRSRPRTFIRRRKTFSGDACQIS